MKKSKKPGIREFLAAGTPILFVRTCENAAAEAKVREETFDIKPDSKFGVWKVTYGIKFFDASGESRNDVPGDILRALRHLETSRESIVCVFHNVRFYMENPQVIQQVVDTADAVKLKGSHIVFVGNYLVLPEELSHLVMVVDFALPGRAEIENNFTLMVNAYKNVIKLPKGKENIKSLIRNAADSAVGLPMSTAENAIALSIATSGKLDLDIIQSQKEQEIRKSDCLEFVTTDETMDTVGGFDEFKAWMGRRSRVFTDEAREYGLPYPKGILIAGVPGSGKSLVAKAVASYLKLPLVKLDIGRVYGSLVGESEARMRLALKTIEAVAPVVMWVDEIDKTLAGSSSSAALDSGVTSRVVSTLLTWRQETNYPVMMVCTANDVENLPSAVYRKGRIDEVWSTDLPTKAERVAIIKIHIAKRNRDPEKFKVDVIAQQSEGFVGSELESCIEDGMFYAFSENVELSTRHILTAIKDTTPQSRRDSKEIEKIRKWVEANARYVGVKEFVGVGVANKGSSNKIAVLPNKLN